MPDLPPHDVNLPPGVSRRDLEGTEQRQLRWCDLSDNDKYHGLCDWISGHAEDFASAAMDHHDGEPFVLQKLADKAISAVLAAYQNKRDTKQEGSGR
jgi:hypothetical protein